MQEATHTRLTEKDRLRRDKTLMDRLLIFHKPESTSDAWPEHLRNTFQTVQNLRNFRYESYDDDVLPQHSTSAWRLDTKLRAKELSDVACRLLNENPTELKWRLETEGFIDARFRKNTTCETCNGPGRSGRLWRSEIEVVTESNGLITSDLEARRKTRVPCQCTNVIYSGINPLFSNRADQAFDFDPSLSANSEKERSGKKTNHKRESLPERKPDRVYGLRQTSNFLERLSRPATKSILDAVSDDTISDVQRIVDNNDEELLVRDLLHATPFYKRGEPLLFPFLLLEAKFEEGRGHRNSAIQSSLPIWALLKAQERLSGLSCSMDELGGPFVWYISYLGDSWHVSGCHTMIEKGRTTYHIRDMWNNRISSPDGALQLLLIIDYIFDWARDLYRPTILHCLEEIPHAPDDAISLAADSDINSCRKTCRMDTRTEEEVLDIPVSDDLLLEPWKKHDIRECNGGLAYNWRSFRPSYIIKSSFQCLYLTRDNMNDFVNCLGASPSKQEKMARDGLQALSKGPIIVTERILSQIENTWTGRIRENHRALTGDKMFCSIVHAVSISRETWELTRTIFCFAVDHDTLEKLRQNSTLKRPSFRLEGIENSAPAIKEHTVSAFLAHLQSQKSQDILAYALGEISDVWKPVDMLSKDEQEQLGPSPEYNVILQPLVGGAHPIQGLVQEIYRRHKPAGLLEPDTPCLRFSSQVEQLETRVIRTNMFSLLPATRYPALQIPEDGAILVCYRYRNYKHLCVYVTKDFGHPPQLVELISTLATAILENQFFILSRFLADTLDTRIYFLQPTVLAGDELFPLIKTAGQLWGEKLCRNLSKEDETYLMPEIFKAHEDWKETLHYSGGKKRQTFSGEITFSSTKRRRPDSDSWIEEVERYLYEVEGVKEEEDIRQAQALLTKLGEDRFWHAVSKVSKRLKS